MINEGHALVIDPGGPFDELDSILKTENAGLDAIVLTHAHFDHIGGIPSILEKHPVPVYVHSSEFDFFEDDKLNVSSYFGRPFRCTISPTALTLPKCKIGSFELEVLHTPGHTRGSCVFLIDQYMFSGDMPTGSYSQMNESLHRLKKLYINYIVYPGHGPASTLEHEKQWNSFME